MDISTSMFAWAAFDLSTALISSEEAVRQDLLDGIVVLPRLVLAYRHPWFPVDQYDVGEHLPPFSHRVQLQLGV